MQKKKKKKKKDVISRLILNLANIRPLFDTERRDGLKKADETAGLLQ